VKKSCCFLPVVVLEYYLMSCFYFLPTLGNVPDSPLSN
jgi:hypothetical protein